MAFLTKFANLTVTDNAKLGPPNNINISGGAQGFGLLTDGLGNLSWDPVGTVSQIDASGSGLGFSLGGGPITTGGTITLTTPTVQELRSSLSIGTVANVFLSGSMTQVLLGNGQWGNAPSNPVLSNIKYATEYAEFMGDTGSDNVDVYILNNAIKVHTNSFSQHNFTLNITGNATTQLSSILSNPGGFATLTTTFMFTNPPGIASSVANIQIDGATQTVKWSGGEPPTSTEDSTMVYTFTILRETGSFDYIVLGSGTRFA